MDIVAAYEQVGTYRGAATLCGTTHKTVRRVIEANRQGEPPDRPRRPGPRNTDVVRDVIAEKVRATDGRISAKRLLPAARAAGYVGSDRNFRRAVAKAKKRWARQRRIYRPWVPVPGEHLVIDWCAEGGWQIFCAVLPWSRWRFVRVARETVAGAIRITEAAYPWRPMSTVPAAAATAPSMSRAPSHPPEATRTTWIATATASPVRNSGRHHRQ